MRALILFFFFQACNAPIKIQNQEQAQEQALNCSFIVPKAEVKPCCSFQSKEWIEACLPFCESILFDVDFERKHTYQKIKCFECSKEHGDFLKDC